MEDIKFLNDGEDIKLLNGPEEGFINFRIDDEVIIEISKKGFFYKGECVDDIHNIYEKLNDFFNTAEQNGKAVGGAC